MAAPARTARARREPSGSIADSGRRAPIGSIPRLASLRSAPRGQGSEKNAEGRIPGCRAPSHGSPLGRGRGSAAQRPQAAGGGAVGRACCGAGAGAGGADRWVHWGADCRVHGRGVSLQGALGGSVCRVHGRGAVCRVHWGGQFVATLPAHTMWGDRTHSPHVHALLSTLQHSVPAKHPADSAVLAPQL